MAGPKLGKKRHIGSFGAKPDAGGDPCDISITLDLMGVRRDVATAISPGSSLEVSLINEGALVAVACTTADGDVAGTLAAFPGLVRLIDCIQSGVRFRALVEEASATRCVVTVERDQ